MSLSEDERGELRAAARSLLADASSPACVRALLDAPVGHDRAVWSTMVELGWPAIPIATRHGGLGATYADVAVVLHELGRAVTPSPLLPTVVGATALSATRNDSLARETLPEVAAGRTVLTAALSGPSGSYEASQLGVRMDARHGSLVIEGSARFVPDAHVADRMVVSARDGSGGVGVVLVDRRAAGVTVEVEPTFDQTRRLATVHFDGVEVRSDAVLAEPDTGAELHDRLVSIGAIAAVCDAVGAAERSLEVATDYAKQRVQFGRPIGSFQAVKHHLANMLTSVEASRAAAAMAVEAIDDDGDVGHAAAVATSYAGPALAWSATLAIQVLGGIGFTWEHDAHLYLKRIKLDEALFGTPKWHRQRLAAQLLD